MKKLVLRLDVHDDKAKRKAMKTVASFLGVDSIAMDMNERKLTVIGDADLLAVAGKLKKGFHADIETIGPAKEENQKPEKVEGDGDTTGAPNVQYTTCNPYISPRYLVVSEQNPNPCGFWW